MNEIDFISKLSRAARGEAPPTVDVAQSVVADIRSHSEPADTRIWGAAAAVSSLAASVVAVVALRILLTHMDPLQGLFNPIVMVIQ